MLVFYLVCFSAVATTHRAAAAPPSSVSHARAPSTAAVGRLAWILEAGTLAPQLFNLRLHHVTIAHCTFLSLFKCSLVCIVNSQKKSAFRHHVYLFCPPQKYFFIWAVVKSQTHTKEKSHFDGEIIYCFCADSSTSGLSSGLVGRGGRNLRTTGENRLGLSWRSLFRSLASPQ